MQKNYQNSLKTCFITTKETALAPFNLARPVYLCKKFKSFLLEFVNTHSVT